MKNSDTRYSKTHSVLLSIVNVILTYGGVATVIAFTLLMLNTKYVFETKSTHIVFRIAEIAIGAEMLLFFVKYNRTLQKKIKTIKEAEKTSRRFNAGATVKLIEREHTKIKTDMLFAGILTYAMMIGVMRLISFASIKYASYISLYHAQTILQTMLHCLAFCVPAVVWNTKDVPAHLGNISRATLAPIKISA